MHTFDFSPKLQLTARRCYQCGRYWAIESSCPASALCPRCQEEQTENARDTVRQLERTISCLRGALTKAKKRLLQQLESKTKRARRK